MSAMHEPSTSDPETMAARLDDDLLYALYPEARLFDAGGEPDDIAYFGCHVCDAEDGRPW